MAEEKKDQGKEGIDITPDELKEMNETDLDQVSEGIIEGSPRVLVSL